MTPEEYIEAGEKRELKDPALNAHLKAGYSVRRVFLDHVTDPSSLDYSTMIEMLNPNFRPEKRKIAANPIIKPVRRLRACLAQWQMSDIKHWDEFERNVDFFINTADVYHSHFLVFPE